MSSDQTRDRDEVAKRVAETLRMVDEHPLFERETDVDDDEHEVAFFTRYGSSEERDASQNGAEEVPIDKSWPERFPEALPVIAVEGGVVYVDEREGAFWVIADGSAAVERVEPVYTALRYRDRDRWLSDVASLIDRHPPQAIEAARQLQARGDD